MTSKHFYMITRKNAFFFDKKKFLLKNLVTFWLYTACLTKSLVTRRYRALWVIFKMFSKGEFFFFFFYFSKENMVTKLDHVLQGVISPLGKFQKIWERYINFFLFFFKAFSEKKKQKDKKTIMKICIFWCQPSKFFAYCANHQKWVDLIIYQYNYV
jgi:hypothetical protein